MQQDNLQFYPTPKALAERAWAKFKNKNVTRLLEPSAGTGELLAAARAERNDYHARPLAWDAVEIDIRHHARLRELGASIVGFDFLDQASCAIYSHVLMNPPFAQGVQHVLHAWNTLFSGEIVAIINAETVRNPFSTERRQLLTLINEFGSVEFIEQAFEGPDVERTASVDIALVHLVKEADGADIIGDIIGNLDKDATNVDEEEAPGLNELALPANFVENTVRNFNAAVQAARQASEATVRADYYAARLGLTLEQLQQREAADPATAQVGVKVREGFAEQYEGLKNAAWTQILRSTQVLSKLSSKAQKRAESQFEDIKALEFTVANVYGFLAGLSQSGTQMQLEMACDVFDIITRYHSENTAYYMGWRSNDRHRTVGMRIKTTRFVLPGEAAQSWTSVASHHVRQMLADFDKVFAMLDGKKTPVTSLEELFATQASFKRLKDGERLRSDYFDVRYYPGIGTIHFFALRKDLVDRLNRVVGQQRQWLPSSMEEANADFREQFDNADKYRGAIEREFKARARGGYRGARLEDLGSPHEEYASKANDLVASALETVQEQHGLRPFDAIESKAGPKLLKAA